MNEEQQKFRTGKEPMNKRGDRPSRRRTRDLGRGRDGELTGWISVTKYRRVRGQKEETRGSPHPEEVSSQRWEPRAERVNHDATELKRF